MQAIDLAPRLLKEQGNSYSSTNGEIWRDAMGFYRLETPPPPVHAPHCIRCDTLPPEEQIGLAERRIDKCNGEVKECRTRQSNYKRSSSHWKSLQETIDSREEEIAQERQYIESLGGFTISASETSVVQPQTPAPPERTPEYASVHQLEQYVRQWVFSPECPDRALEEIKAKTPEGKQFLKSLSALIGVPHRVADLRQACHNVRSALGGSASLSQLSHQEQPLATAQEAQPSPSSSPDISQLVEATIVPTPPVKLIEELTPEEESERHRLELKVERAFYEAGAALRELRDKRLYRSTHKTFEQYCRERFRYNRSRSYQLIDAAAVVDNLSKCPQFVDKLPVNESQCRPLADLEPEEQCQAWGELLDQTGGDRPTGRAVKGIVEQKKAKPPTSVTDSYSKDQVFTLTGLSGQERKYNGCWAITTAVNNFTLEVEVYDATLTVKPDNLKPVDSPAECQQIGAIAQRIRRLRQCELDRGAYPILESLGRHTHLTPLEEELLTFLEKRYLEARFDVS